MSANELDKKVDQIRELKRLIEEAEAEIIAETFLLHFTRPLSFYYTTLSWRGD